MSPPAVDFCLPPIDFCITLIHCCVPGALQVAVLLGTVVMCCSSAVLLLSRNQIGKLFSSEHGVVMLTAQAVPPLAVSLIGEGANTVLAGVMRGCGRQRIGATINLVTYWLFGLPIACLLAFPGWLGVCACVCVCGGGGG